MINGISNSSYSNYENKYNLYNQNPYSSVPNTPEDDRRLISDTKKANDDSPLNDKQKEECQTCKNRKYKDGSNDPGVSYKTPTKIKSGAAAAAVKSHEHEHVSRERAKAQREGKEIIYQNVTIHTAICPECHKSYVSGGTTRTVTRNSNESQMNNMENEEKGKFIDIRV